MARSSLSLSVLAAVALLAAAADAARIETIAEYNQPAGLAVGPDGALYVCEVGNHVIQRLDLNSGKSAVVAGRYGKKGYSGDGGPATDALLNEPFELRFAPNGDLYFVEIQNFVVRRIDHRTKLISTIAGTGVSGFSGDGGPAAKAEFGQPHSLAFDRSGGLLVCDVKNDRVRRIDLATGMIGTFAGPLPGPRAIDLDPAGNIFVVLREGNAVVKLGLQAGTLTTVAGTGRKGFSGNGGSSLAAAFSGPKGLSVASDGSLYVADTENHQIRRIDAATSLISAIAGTGERGDGREEDPLRCKLSRPHGIFVAADGTVFIGDTESNKVRRISSDRSTN